jgi:glycosyltransferase involved in cell wall biosynthesis
MHVVVLFRYFWPESRVSEEPHMLREIVHRHVARGDTVDVICGSADDCREVWAREFPERVRVRSFRAPVDRNGPLFVRVLNSARLLFRGLGALLWPSRIDLLYLFTYPPGFAGAIISFCRVFRRRTRILFSFQDNLEYRIGNPLIRACYRAYNRFCVSHATVTTVLSEEMREHLLESVPLRSRENVGARIEVVNNFYAEDVAPARATAAKAYDILYAGNHGPGQNLAFFIEALSRCRPQTSARVVFYGGGTEKEALRTLARERGAPIEFRDPVDRQTIATEMQAARYGLVAMLPELPKYAFPSKIIAYTCNGTKALLMCDPAGPLGRWVIAERLGDVLDVTDVDRAAKGLEALLAATDDGDPRDTAGRAATLFGKDVFLSRIEAILARLFA